LELSQSNNGRAQRKHFSWTSPGPVAFENGQALKIFTGILLTPRSGFKLYFSFNFVHFINKHNTI